MVLKFSYEIIGSQTAEIEIDDAEIEGMSAEDVVSYAYEKYGFKASSKAENDCDYAIGGLENIKILECENEDLEGFEEWYV